MIKELIDQMGGRERLDQMSQCSDVTKLFAYEMRHMARALLAVLDAQENPAGTVTAYTINGVVVNRCKLSIGDKVYTVPPAASVNYPAIPEGWIPMPKKLTAENGAKAALSGDFTEHKFINCSECFGDDECESCDGSGLIKVEVTLSWSTIKAIWEKGADHFAAAPAPENKK